MSIVWQIDISKGGTKKKAIKFLPLRLSVAVLKFHFWIQRTFKLKTFKFSIELVLQINQFCISKFLVWFVYMYLEKTSAKQCGRVQKRTNSEYKSNWIGIWQGIWQRRKGWRKEVVGEEKWRSRAGLYRPSRDTLWRLISN